MRNIKECFSLIVLLLLVCSSCKDASPSLKGEWHSPRYGKLIIGDSTFVRSDGTISNYVYLDSILKIIDKNTNISASEKVEFISEDTVIFSSWLTDDTLYRVK